ncbi:MAG TPA: glycoside hydrolase family 104 protein [Candidatus Aquabacterium excrementipullorum]|nr:glycoside hydrolase family 104 protein [Candidatus Aquabacterium excrementipullorum]
MLRFAEGTAGVNGYRTLFGGSLFSSYDDHPRIAKQFTDGQGRRLWTTAAGAYQAMAVSPIPTGGSTKVNTWDRIKAKLGLRDFTPASQDAFALELIREAGALADVRAGRLADAINKVRGIWASLPGAGYSQPEKSLAALTAAYQRNGGALA